jgi:hypothetical protein
VSPAHFFNAVSAEAKMSFHHQIVDKLAPVLINTAFVLFLLGVTTAQLSAFLGRTVSDSRWITTLVLAVYMM